MKEAKKSHVDSELPASLFQIPDAAFVSVYTQFGQSSGQKCAKIA